MHCLLLVCFHLPLGILLGVIQRTFLCTNNNPLKRNKSAHRIFHIITSRLCRCDSDVDDDDDDDGDSAVASANICTSGKTPARLLLTTLSTCGGGVVCQLFVAPLFICIYITWPARQPRQFAVHMLKRLKLCLQLGRYVGSVKYTKESGWWKSGKNKWMKVFSTIFTFTLLWHHRKRNSCCIWRISVACSHMCAVALLLVAHIWAATTKHQPAPRYVCLCA